MRNFNEKQKRPIKIVLSLNAFKENIRTLVTEILDEIQGEKTICCFILFECHRQDSNAQKKKTPKRTPHTIRYLRLVLAASSFFCDIIIAITRLLLFQPPGEITCSVISVVSDLLNLCGTILGVREILECRGRKKT